MEAQEVALLAERERLMQDGQRQRGLEEELRRLQNEHDRYQLWFRPASHSAYQHSHRRRGLGWVSHCPLCVLLRLHSVGVALLALGEQLSLLLKSSEAAG